MNSFRNVGLVTGVLLFMALGATGLLAVFFLGSLDWFYADLYRDCSGMLCVEITAVGWIVLIGYGALCGLLGGYVGKKLFERANKYKAAFISLSVIMTVLIAITSAFGLSYVSEYMPNVPSQIRCLSVILDTQSSIDDGINSGRTNCVSELAQIKKDAGQCWRIEEVFFRTRCVGGVAKVTQNPALCENTPKEIYIDDCINATLFDVKSPPSSGKPHEVNYNELTTASVAGGAANANYFVNADMPTKPKTMWSSNLEYPNTLPLAVDTYVLAQYKSGRNCQNGGDLALYDGLSGSALWELRGKDFIGYCAAVDYSPALSKGILVYADFENLFAVDMVNHKEVWRKTMATLGSPRIRNDVVYILDPRIGSSGDKKTLSAFGLKTGNLLWSIDIGLAGSYVRESFALSGTNVFIAENGADMTKYDSRKGAPEAVVVNIVDLASGKSKFRTVITSDRQVVAGPVFDQGIVFVRSTEGIIGLDEQTGKQVFKFPEPLQKVGTNKGLALGAHEQMLYYKKALGEIVALDTKSGKYLWRADVGEDITVSTVISDSYIYFATDHDIYALDRKTGKRVWQYSLTVPIKFPLQLSNGLMYFITTAGRFYAIK